MAEDRSRVATLNSGGRSGSKSGDGGAGGGKAKKSKKKLIIIAVVVLLVVGAAAKFTVLAPKASADAAKAKPAPGPVIAMDELTLNLDGGHFLRLKLSIETTKGTSEDLDLTEGQQAVIDEYSNKTTTALTGQKSRDTAKADLLAKLQKVYPKKILDVYYTEFVMQ
jgi:flagellar protein FliL